MDFLKELHKSCLKGKILNYFLLLALLVLAPSLKAQSVQPTEYDIKAAFLFNFAKFTNWPPDKAGETDSLFNICILGENPFKDLLNHAAEHNKIKGLDVIVREIQSLDSLGRCQILFVALSQNNHYREIVDSLDNNSIMTIGESKEFTDCGGIINFFVKENNVRFRINVNAAAKAGLDISSKLLRLAELTMKD